MSAPPPAGLLIEAMRSQRDEEIEQFIRQHPERFERLAPVTVDREPLQVNENFDRVQIGETFGAYRRKNHRGSADE